MLTFPFLLQVDLSAIVAGAVGASLANLTTVSDTLLLEANQTLALLTFLGNLNLGGLSGLSTLTDLVAVQVSVNGITELDLVTVINSLLSPAPQNAKRDEAYLATGLLDDHIALIALIESLEGIVEDIVSSTAFIILQQLGVTDLVNALAGNSTAA